MYNIYYNHQGNKIALKWSWFIQTITNNLKQVNEEPPDLTDKPTHQTSQSIYMKFYLHFLLNVI